MSAACTAQRAHKQGPQIPSAERASTKAAHQWRTLHGRNNNPSRSANNPKAVRQHSRACSNIRWLATQQGGACRGTRIGSGCRAQGWSLSIALGPTRRPRCVRRFPGTNVNLLMSVTSTFFASARGPLVYNRGILVSTYSGIWSLPSGGVEPTILEYWPDIGMTWMTLHRYDNGSITLHRPLQSDCMAKSRLAVDIE